MCKKREDFGCAGRWEYTQDGNEFTCDHEFAGYVCCDDCKFGANPESGLDPRYSPNHIRNHRGQKRVKV